MMNLRHYISIPILGFCVAVTSVEADFGSKQTRRYAGQSGHDYSDYHRHDERKRFNYKRDHKRRGWIGHSRNHFYLYNGSGGYFWGGPSSHYSYGFFVAPNYQHYKKRRYNEPRHYGRDRHRHDHRCRH